MKNKQHDQAKELYFQTNLSKTEIAEKVGVTRKTVLFWAQQGNWYQLRKSARTLPSIVAEKCYYLVDQYASHLLTDGAIMANFSLRDAQVLHLLAGTIKKLKNRSTVNESMEMFNFFLENLNKRNPGLAEQVSPEIENYIDTRRRIEKNDVLLEEFNDDGSLPYRHKQQQEQWQDEDDNAQLWNDFETFLETRAAGAATPAGDTPPMPPASGPGSPAPGNDLTHISEAA